MNTIDSSDKVLDLTMKRNQAIAEVALLEKQLRDAEQEQRYAFAKNLPEEGKKLFSEFDLKKE